MIGETISQYRIIEKPGSGGLGVVYEVEEKELRRRVALNVFPPERTGDGSAKRRFSQEAQSDSALQHPTTCIRHDVDQSAHARIFNSLSCSEGAILTEGIDRRRPRCKAKAERSSDQELIA